MLYRNKASVNKLIEKNMLLEESQHLKATEEYTTKSLIGIVKNNISFSSWLEKVEGMEISINLYQTLSGNEILITVRVNSFGAKRYFRELSPAIFCAPQNITKHALYGYLGPLFLEN